MKLYGYLFCCIWFATMLGCAGSPREQVVGDTAGSGFTGGDGDTDGDSDSDADSDADGDKPLEPEVVTCDNSGDCWNNCWACAAENLCANGQAACNNDAGCAALQACVAECPDDTPNNPDAWWNCYVACGGETGSRAENLLQEFWDCIYCGACKNDCINSGHEGCADYVDPNSPTVPNTGLVWQDANLTWYESYPDPGSAECIQYSGCEYAGYFSYFTEQKSEAWVASTNIAAVHSRDFDQYAGKTLRVRQGGNSIDVKVYDMCADSDCGGCCSANMAETGFLIDMEVYTYNRFGGEHGMVEWACLDCN